MKHIMDDAINKFLDPTIPVWGKDEEEIDEPFWQVSDKETDESFPGEGLARHDMLYIGEGCNKIFLVVGGKIVWTYSTGKGWELDDIWMMTNGNILFSRMSWAAEVTPHKEVVWRMDAPEGAEIHTLQPIGLDRVMVLVNAMPKPRLLIINKKTGVTELDRELPYDGIPNGVHGQHRRFRLTKDNTFLSPYLMENKVVEFDRDFNEIWSYEIPKPWAACRLLNGNTLIWDEQDELVREVRPDKSIAWECAMSELPEEYRVAEGQSFARLDNGNTIICGRGANGTSPQLVEITPDKKVVWVINDWKNFGPATAVHILRDGGIPEDPSQCQR